MITTRRILVIGGGPAGTFAAMAARKQDPDALVTLLSDERCEPYEKPPLSKAVLVGKALPSDAPIAGPGGVAAHDVALEGGARCVSIDRNSRVVVLDDGRRLPYDALVLAMGSTVRILPQFPPGAPAVHYLRTEADAHALKGALESSRHLLVVGAGLIGLEVAASAAERGVAVTVLEVAPRVMARVCDEEISTIVERVHRAHGVDIRLSVMLTDVTTGPDGRIIARTTDGASVAADLVVIGTGVKPNDRLASECGLATADGVVVDEQCRTSDPSIFAAGDVVRFPGPRGLIRLENWRHAQDQGAVAGKNAAGGSDAYSAVPSFWSEQYDLYIQGVGWPVDNARRIVRQLDEPNILIFQVHEGHLVYAMGINAQRDLAAARRLIDRRVPIDPAALADRTRPLASMLRK